MGFPSISGRLLWGAACFSVGIAYPVPTCQAGSCETSGTWASVGGGFKLNPEVRAMVAWTPLGQNPPKLYVGGRFATDQGDNPLNNLAEWDGSEWNAITEMGRDPGVVPIGGGGINSMAIYGGALIVAGEFTLPATMSLPEINLLAAWDGMAWSGFGMDGSSIGVALADSGDLYIAGDVQLPGETGSAWKVARWDGNQWTSLGMPFDFDVVLCLAVFGGELFAGGFDSAASPMDPRSILAKWDGDEWVDVGAGILAESDVQDQVRAMTVFDGSLFVGGVFPPAGGGLLVALVAWNGATWSTLPVDPGVPGNNPGVSHLSVDDEGCDALIISGLIDYVDCATGTPLEEADHIALFEGKRANGDPGCFFAIGEGTSEGGPAIVATIDGQGRRIYVGSALAFNYDGVTVDLFEIGAWDAPCLFGDTIGMDGVSTVDAQSWYLFGDSDRNGLVNFTDILVTFANFSNAYDVCSYRACMSLGDADLDGLVNFSDVLVVLANFSETCP